jgi:hypothetical protein
VREVTAAIKDQGAGDTSAPPSLIVVRNWFTELQRMVPADYAVD